MDTTDITKLKRLIGNAEYRLHTTTKKYKLFNPKTLVGRFFESLQDYNYFLKHETDNKNHDETDILTIEEFITLVKNRMAQIDKPLTPKKIAAYLEKPEFCPYCDSYNIDVDAYEPTFSACSPQCFHDITCLNCGKEWTDIYTLTGFDTKKGN
jgi:hypothetical protein